MSALRLRGAARILVGGPEWEKLSGDLIVRDGVIEAGCGELARPDAGGGRRHVACR